MTVKEAFKNDGFDITGQYSIKSTKPGEVVTGYVGTNKNIINYNNGKYKKAYYIEGEAYDLGYLMGYLAPEEITDMVNNFAGAVFSSLIYADAGPKEKWLLTTIITLFVKYRLPTIIGAKNQKDHLPPKEDIHNDIPGVYHEEIKGMIAGLTKVQPTSKVTEDDLWVINVGFDVAISYFSNPDKLVEEIAKLIQDAELLKGLLDLHKHSLLKAVSIEGFAAELKHFDLLKDLKPKAEHFVYPHWCNAFSAFGNAVDPKDNNKHFFGRDWMMDGADVLANTAAFIIVNPSDGRQPLVYAACPGMMGAVAAMNTRGVAMGVDMVTAGNSNHNRPGFNSILLVRDSVHENCSAEDLASYVTNDVQRGTTYIYPVSDGSNNKACVIEAGFTPDADNEFDPMDYPSLAVKVKLGIDKLIAKIEGQWEKLTKDQKPTKGLFVRWNDYKQPTEFMDTFNKDLFEMFDSKYPEGVWGETGYVFEQPFQDKNAFGYYFFNPQRDKQDDLILVTNAWLNPLMRLCTMGPLNNDLSKPYWTDIQWRYDVLNEALMANYGSLTMETAWSCINFLSPVKGSKKGIEYFKMKGKPKADFPEYEQSFQIIDVNGQEQTTWRVNGMICLFECREDLVARSLTGTYADDYVEINLLNYVIVEV